METLYDGFQKIGGASGRTVGETWVSVSNDGSAQGYHFTTGGFIIGVDYRITDHFAVGVMGGYAHTATNLQPSGDVDVNTGRGGLYATYFDRGFYINAGGYGGYNGLQPGPLGQGNSSCNFSTISESAMVFLSSASNVCARIAPGGLGSRRLPLPSAKSPARPSGA